MKKVLVLMFQIPIVCLSIHPKGSNAAEWLRFKFPRYLEPPSLRCLQELLTFRYSHGYDVYVYLKQSHISLTMLSKGDTQLQGRIKDAFAQFGYCGCEFVRLLGYRYRVDVVEGDVIEGGTRKEVTRARIRALAVIADRRAVQAHTV